MRHISRLNKNYDRYDNVTEGEYYRHRLSYYLMRKPCDKIIIPLLEDYENKDILEVGAGFGYYTKLIIDKNNVEVADVNPRLCEKIGCKVYGCVASEIDKVVTKKYHYILSFWMSEYLEPTELKDFIAGALRCVKSGGEIICTVILDRGLGLAYTYGARLKGIRKYSYSIRDLRSIIETLDADYTIIDMNVLANIRFAVLLKIHKKNQ